MHIVVGLCFGVLLTCHAFYLLAWAYYHRSLHRPTFSFGGSFLWNKKLSRSKDIEIVLLEGIETHMLPVREQVY